MSLLKMLLEAQNGQGLGQLAQQIGIDETEAGGLAGMLGPAISQAAKRRAQSGGIEQVLEHVERHAGRNPDGIADPVADRSGRVEALQVLPERNQTVVEFSVDEHVAGQRTGGSARLLVDGLPAVEVGDRVVAMLGSARCRSDQSTELRWVPQPPGQFWYWCVGTFS